MTEVTRTQHHTITLDAPGEYNVRQTTDGTVVNDKPFDCALSATIDATLREHFMSQYVTAGLTIEPRQSRITEEGSKP